MQQKTLCFLIDQERKKIILGMKKKRFGKGKYNGFGGGVEDGENNEEAALRELKEEAGVSSALKHLQKVGKLNFYFPSKEEWNQTVHVYLSERWKGKLAESEEMAPQEFDLSDMPYDNMWDADKHWLPLVLEGKKVYGNFYFNEDNNTIKKYNIEEF